MMSRQAIVHAMTGKVLDFNETDGGSRCGYLNNFTMAWAKQQSSNKARNLRPKILKKFKYFLLKRRCKDI